MLCAEAPSRVELIDTNGELMSNNTTVDDTH